MLSNVVTRTCALGSLPIGQRGGGSNLLRSAIYQMVECHGRSQGTTGRRNGSCYDAAIVTVTWENIDCLLMTPADCTFNLVINKGALDCVMWSSDQNERRINMYRGEVGRFPRLGDLEDEDGNSDNNEGGGGEGWYNDDTVNSEKWDERGQKEVSNNHNGEEK